MLSLRGYCNLEKRDRVFFPIFHHVGTLPSGSIEFLDWDDEDFPDILTLKIKAANDEVLRPLIEALQAVNAKGDQLPHMGCIHLLMNKSESNENSGVTYELQIIDVRDWLPFMDVKIIVGEIGQQLGIIKHFWVEGDGV